MAVSAQAQTDTIPGEAEYRKHYDCRYEPGNVLIVQKKGKTPISDLMPGKPDFDAFVIRMEGVYDLEFSDGKRFRSPVVKNITDNSITITSTFNANCAAYEGVPFEQVTYALNELKTVRIITERSLGFFKKINIGSKYELIVRRVDKAKLCPAVLTFPKRNNEVKVCHYYLTAFGYNILYETDGYLDWMDYPIESF